jgi:hypothetical protein
MRKQNSKNTRSRAPRRGGRSRAQNAMLVVRVPQYVPTISLSHKFRFNSGSNSGGFSITRQRLLNLLQVATSAITTVRLIEGVRLKLVEMWTNPVALGSTPTTLQLEWFGENSPSTLISDFSMGVNPAHVRAMPPASSSNRWWSMSGSQETDPLFSLSIPANTIIDITVELRLVESETPTAGDIPAGASLGQLYGNYLDGLVSGKLAPDGYTALP